jgi:hypothetical protein
MLGGRDLEGRALDPYGKVFAREPADLDAPTFGLRVELRPVGEAFGRRVKYPSRQRGAQLWTSTPTSVAITPPWFRRSRSLRY